MNCHLVFIFRVFIGAFALTHAAAESRIDSVVQADPTHQIQLVLVTNAAAGLSAGYTAVQHLEFQVVNSTSGVKELLYRSPAWQLRDMNEQSHTGPLYIPKSALISSTRIEILAESILDSLRLLRFSRQGKGWLLEGEAWIAEAMRSDSGAVNATLVDFGKIRVTDEQSQAHKNYEVDQEGVVRLDGAFYIPKRTLLGGTDSPEIAYRRNYKSHIEDYNLPRDANGMTIWEDPVKASTPSTIKVPSSETQKATKAKVDNTSSDSKTSTAPAAAPQTSNLMLFIAGGVIIFGVVVLISEIKNKRKKP